MFVQRVAFINLALAILASSNPLATRETCKTPDGSGTCQSTSTCTGFHEAGFCSGSASNQCCIQKSCTAPSGSGTCKNTDKTCDGGVYVSGYCPGPSTVQCCVTKTTQPPSGGDLAAFDISSAQPAAFWTCAANKYKKAVIRGYQQACGSGGRVDPNLATSFKAAKAAGITNVDAYIFPCTGSGTDGVKCKSPSEQISAFEAAVKAAGMTPAHLWLDIEPCAAGGPCTCWNRGASQNLAEVKEFVALMRQSAYKWGVYANGNQWSEIFGSRSADVASDLPYWAVQFDKKPGVSTVNTFCGGWTKAYAKQYSLSATDCGSNSQGLDLDSFSG